MSEVPEAYQQYLLLVARVDAFGQAIRQRYPGQVTCHAGCDGCCYQQLTVFPVEAYHLACAVASLAPATRQHLRDRLLAPPDPWHILNEPQACVLLEQGRCSLYAARPLMCRMHGFPLASGMIERPDGKQRDCCPLNFSAIPVDDIAPRAVYNLDLVNQTLAAINYLFVQGHGLSDQRLTIRQAVLQALAEDGPPACTPEQLPEPR